MGNHCSTPATPLSDEKEVHALTPELQSEFPRIALGKVAITIHDDGKLEKVDNPKLKVTFTTQEYGQLEDSDNEDVSTHLVEQIEYNVTSTDSTDSSGVKKKKIHRKPTGFATDEHMVMAEQSLKDADEETHHVSFEGATEFHEVESNCFNDGDTMTHNLSITSTASERRRYRKPTGYSTKEHMALSEQALEEADAEDRMAEGEMTDMMTATASMTSVASERIRTRKPTGYVNKEQAKKARIALAAAAREEAKGSEDGCKHRLSGGSSIGRRLLGCGVCGRNGMQPNGISSPR